MRWASEKQACFWVDLGKASIQGRLDRKSTEPLPSCARHFAPKKFHSPAQTSYIPLWGTSQGAKMGSSSSQLGVAKKDYQQHPYGQPHPPKRRPWTWEAAFFRSRSGKIRIGTWCHIQCFLFVHNTRENRLPSHLNTRHAGNSEELKLVPPSSEASLRHVFR